MAPRYTLRVITGFSAAHALRNYPGDCSRLHGHNWKLEVEVLATALDGLGMGMDFKAIKASTHSCIRQLDHRYLNEMEPFDSINPTAENIAAYLYRRLSHTLNDDRVLVSSVTLWETDQASVRYTEEDQS